MAWDASQIVQVPINIFLVLLEVKLLLQYAPLFAEMVEYFHLKSVMTGLLQLFKSLAVKMTAQEIKQAFIVREGIK